MTKHGFMRIVLLALSILILAGVALLAWVLLFGDQDVIVVSLEDNKETSIQFEHLGLVPGESCEYDIRLQHNCAQSCQVRLQFVEAEEKTLKQFAFVKILAGETVVCDERMADVFDGEAIVLPVDFDAGINTELKIIYYLPLDVGNEAKYAEAIFELLLIAGNE